jgi:signal transduction histidine kinase
MDDDLTRVESNVKALLSMANGLRQRIPELGKLEQERTVVPVKALLEDAAWSLHVPENIKLDSQLEDDLPDVSIVYGQVIDILRNLVINSIEAMQDGGVITVRASYERGQVGNPSQHVQIEVTDTGPGIPPAMQSKVFNLFFSTKKSSGFGLWSARQYARANGGDLTLISSEGKGVKFTLTLPVALKHEVVP